MSSLQIINLCIHCNQARRFVSHYKSLEWYVMFNIALPFVFFHSQNIGDFAEDAISLDPYFNFDRKYHSE